MINNLLISCLVINLSQKGKKCQFDKAQHSALKVCPQPKEIWFSVTENKQPPPQKITFKGTVHLPNQRHGPVVSYLSI